MWTVGDVDCEVVVAAEANGYGGQERLSHFACRAS